MNFYSKLDIKQINNNNMKMKTITKRFLILFLAVVTMVIGANATPTAYAVYRGGTLTFKFGERPTNETYCFNASNTGTSPEWSTLQPSLIEKVVFDSSFMNAHPKSCARWFYGMENLKTVTNLECLNTSEVSSMAGMFTDCKSLTSLDVSGFNTSDVTTMYFMFKGCEKLMSLDVSGFNTSNVTSMAKMFMDCQSLTSLDVSGFNTSKVTDMSSMFYMCYKLTGLDVSGFNTSNVQDMMSMFESCEGLTSIDVSGFNTSNVTNMYSMFCWCKNLKSLDLRNFDTSNVTSMRLMFSDCQLLTTIYCNDSWNSSCPSDNMFSSCTNLKGAISYNKSKTTATYANPETGYFTYKGYDLWVNGTQVTHTNCNDLSVISGVSGTVKYDKNTNTLTLDNATITATGNSTSYAISSDMPNLKIAVTGNNTLSYTYGGGIRSNGSLVLSGTDGSSLSVSGTTALVMTSEKENRLNVKDLNLTLDGTSYYGVFSSHNSTVMEIQGNSEVKTRGVLECYRSLKDIIIPEGYEVREPTGAYISGGKMYAADGNTVKNEWVTIGPKGYDLWVGGVQVNVTNCSNITGSNIKQGTVTYDDETKTLTLTDCSISMDNIAGTVGIKSRMDSLAIHLVGNNGISMVDTGIESTGDVTIAGPGKLGFVICNTGIYMTEISLNDLLVTDGAKLDMTLVGTGVLGKKWNIKIAGQTITTYPKTLRVSGGMTDVNIVASTSAISDMNKLVLNDGLSLTAPVGAKFASHAVCDKDGNVVKGKNVRFSLAGDVNNDGAVTMADANAVVNYFLATDKPSSFDVDNANVNGDADDDGKPSITMADANAIVNMFLGQ